jgi:hypothetical protein
MKSKAMRFIWSYILICLAVLVCNSSTVFSAVPQIVNYQGSLSDAGGNPVNATLNITFSLHDVAGGPGTILWQETQSVTVTNGQFSVQLGADALNPLDPAIVQDPIFLGVQVGGDAEMTPRQKFTSTAFAFHAETVENDTLNSLSCSANEIPKFIGGVWTCAADDGNTGDITGVTAGNGLTGGGLSGDVNIAADTNVIQNRVSGSCPAGQHIRVINQDGTVTCEVDNDTNTNAATLCTAGTFLNGDGSCDPVITDTDTTYSAGSGLTLSGTTFSIAANGVTSTEIADDAVTAAKIAGGAGSGVDADLLDGLEASAIEANAVAQATTNNSVLYTRWGRSDCPTGATLVYTGIAGSSHYTQGSGANQLCLSLEPTFAQFSDASQDGALLYATQYWSVGSVPVIAAVHQHFVPCAVCERSSAAVMFMQPGRDTCPTGFNTEYPGYLMATHYQHRASEFVCVDQAPASFTGSAGSGSLGNLLYTTEAECPTGTPLCLNNYVNQREVTCSVCSK